MLKLHFLKKNCGQNSQIFGPTDEKFSKMVEIYFKEQANRKKELIFFEFLKKNITGIRHINANYLLPIELLTNQIDVPRVIQALKNDLKLSQKKKEITIVALSKLPQKINVARTINSVSVDFVIKNETDIQFIELHEKQHSQLTVPRAVPVFDSENNRYEIPRFAQRLLKDVWRWENLPNYKIVWWDWFELNQNKFQVSELFENKKIEYFRDNKFCFSKLE